MPFLTHFRDKPIAELSHSELLELVAELQAGRQHEVSYEPGAAGQMRVPGAGHVWDAYGSEAHEDVWQQAARMAKGGGE